MSQKLPAPAQLAPAFVRKGLPFGRGVSKSVSRKAIPWALQTRITSSNPTFCVLRRRAMTRKKLGAFETALNNGALLLFGVGMSIVLTELSICQKLFFPTIFREGI